MSKIDQQERPQDAGEIPIVRESDPALGRLGGYLRGEREASGNLPDDPVDGNPVVNPNPFGPLRR